MSIRLVTFKVAVKVDSATIAAHHKLFAERKSLITHSLETTLLAHGFTPIRILGGFSIPAEENDTSEM